ncbi:MAG: ComEA family DNA-binding protein [Candidatus Methylomirabilia bacterium]
MVYRRRELWLLLLLASSLGFGLAVREFRSSFPELVERVERFDSPQEPLRSKPPPPRAGPSKATAETQGRLDLNRASVAELQRLPGIGPILARRIVETRQRDGPFRDAEDLRRVPGIGEKKLEAIRDLIIVRE